MIPSNTTMRTDFLWLSLSHRCTKLIFYWHRQHKPCNNNFVTCRSLWICCLIFQLISCASTRLWYKKKRVTTCYLSLIFSVLQSHFISWFIHMTDVLMHAEESLGVLCSWTPPAVWVCYLNPWSRVPFLAFSWSLTADPGWNSPNTGANRTVKYENPLQFSHMGMRSHVIVCTCICVCRCVYIKRTCSQIEIFSLLRRSTYSRKPALV